MHCLIFEATLFTVSQGEVYEDPNSVDINSEEFASLPPEMKHDILKDMKEFSKRRRTMYHKPPEVQFTLIHTHTHTRLLLLTQTFLFFVLAFRRFFPVSAGRPAAEEPTESASGECGERDERAERWQCSTAPPTGRGPPESQCRITPTGFRGQFPLYPY